MSDKANQITALQTAIELIGGYSATARGIGVRPQAVAQWDICPAARVLQVERLAGGKVSRHELRPDIYPIEAVSQ